MDHEHHGPPASHPAVAARPPALTGSLGLVEGTGETARAAEAHPLTGAQVCRIASALARAAKACRLYPPDNRLRVRFTAELFSALEDALAIAPAVCLVVGKTRLEWNDETVLEQEDREELIPGRLYWDGLRSLSFHAGVTPDELGHFLETLALAEVKREAGDEDLATLLWSRSLPHIRHLAIDDLVEREERFDPFEIPGEFTDRTIAEVDAEPMETTDATRGEFSTEAALAHVWDGLGGGHEATLFQVPPESLASLRAEVASPENPDAMRTGFLRIVRETLALEQDPRALTDLVEIVRAAVVALISQGDVAFAADLIEVVHDLRQRTRAPSAEVCRVLDRTLGLELDAPALQAWVEQLDEPHGPALDALPRLVESLGPGAISTFCEVLGRLETARARRRLIDLLVIKGRGQVDRFAPAMQDERWFLVRNVTMILGEIASPQAAELLRPAVSHRDVRVRKQALSAVCHLGEAAALPHLTHALADRDPGLRLWAARALAVHGPRALFRLAEVLESKEFERRDLAERAAFYEAYAYAGREEAVSYLVRTISQRRALKHRHLQPVRACLCRALGIAGGAEARSALERLRRDRSAVVREAARTALEMLAIGAPPPPSEPEEMP